MGFIHLAQGLWLLEVSRKGEDRSFHDTECESGLALMAMMSNKTDKSLEMRWNGAIAREHRTVKRKGERRCLPMLRLLLYAEGGFMQSLYVPSYLLYTCPRTVLIRALIPSLYIALYRLYTCLRTVRRICYSPLFDYFTPSPNIPVEAQPRARIETV